MMGYGTGYPIMAGTGFGLFGLWTWVLLIVFLVLGIVYFWKGITKKK